MTSQQEVIEGNKIIAEFMQVEYSTEFHGMLCEINSEEGSPWDNDPLVWLNYDSNWNLLMSVVEKIEMLWNPFNENCIYDEHEFSEFNISDDCVEIDTAGFKDGIRRQFQYLEGWHLKEKSEEIKRHHVWLAVVQLVTYYNSLNQNQK